MATDALQRRDGAADNMAMNGDLARPAPVLVAAVLVAALLSAGVVAATDRSGASRAAGDARAASLAGATALDEAPAPAAPPSTTTAVEAPTSTTRTAAPGTSVTRPSSRPAPASTTATTRASTAKAGASSEQPVGTYGPRDPSSVTVPYEPGRSSWSGTSNGLGLKVTMQPASPKAGEPIQFVVEATSPDANCCQLRLLFGDQFSWPSAFSMAECDSFSRRKQAEVTHAYNGHGRREIMFSAFANGCTGDGPTGRLYASFDVAPGVSSSQGPAPPNVRFDTTVRPPAVANDPRYVTVGGMVTDDDGYVARLVLDWGDGSPAQTLPGDGVGCRTSLGGWPLQSMVLIPSNPVVMHHYTAPGAYRITLTAISTACDGSDEQRGVGTIQWRVPG